MRYTGVVKISLVFFVISIIAVGFFYWLFIRVQHINKATSVQLLDFELLLTSSHIQQNSETLHISLYSKEGFLYKTNNTGKTAVAEFLQSNLYYQQNQTLTKKMFPSHLLRTFFLKRQLRDEEDKFLIQRNLNLKGEHYFYTQNIKGLPVYGAHLAIHMRNVNEIYATEADLVVNENINEQKISEDEAKKIALTTAQKETIFSLVVGTIEKVIFNYDVIGLDGDKQNHSALAITILSTDELTSFAKKYIVDITTGEILFTESLIKDALDRSIANCDGGVFRCPIALREGSQPIGNQDVDTAYTTFGDIYTYFNSVYGRDSYDDRGGPIRSFVNITIQEPCPNARWVGGGVNQTHFCKGMAANDIIAHEYTHGITEHTAGLIYQLQSGALNESISDIFSYAIDSDPALGEDSVVGALRYLDDPPRRNQPDRLFSPRYYCGTGDNGGVHINSGVINKAFYLMTVGGSFNGCNISGIGKEKSLPIFYRALTTYLTSPSNFKDMYRTLIQSCTDIYRDPVTCAEVVRSLQVTEIDQQPDNQLEGARCLRVAQQPADCTTVSPGFTLTPTRPQQPTVQPTVSLSPSPTPPPAPPRRRSPTPTSTPSLIPTIVGCQCQQDISCSQSCIFEQHNCNDGSCQFTYANPILCRREVAVGPAPNQDERTAYCQRQKRTLGDADGDGTVGPTDYFYYIRIVVGGVVPPVINSDFNGDGVISPSDLGIIKKTLGQ